MTEGGYVRLHRKLLNSTIWTRLSPAVLKVAIYFLLKANWKRTDWYNGRRQVLVPRGAFVTSYARVAGKCRLTLKHVRSAFKHLEQLKFASYGRDPFWTMVTVSNYNDYQAENDGLNPSESGAEFRTWEYDFSGQGEGTVQGSDQGIATNPVSHATTHGRSLSLRNGAKIRQAQTILEGRKSAGLGHSEGQQKKK
jgi:hypothetical protein